MDAISKVTDAITHPVQTAGSVASQALGLATAAARTSTRALGWAVNQGRSALPGAAPFAIASTDDASAENAPVKKAPVQKAPVQKAPVKKAPAKKAPVQEAPTAQGATAGPAQPQPAEADDEGNSTDAQSADGAPGHATGETAQSQPDPEPLLDPSTAKAIRSEAEVMQKASDPDKG